MRAHERGLQSSFVLTDIDKINKRLDKLSAQLKSVGLPTTEKAKRPKRGR